MGDERIATRGQIMLFWTNRAIIVLSCWDELLICRSSVRPQVGLQDREFKTKVEQNEKVGAK